MIYFIKYKLEEDGFQYVFIINFYSANEMLKHRWSSENVTTCLSQRGDEQVFENGLEYCFLIDPMKKDS